MSAMHGRRQARRAVTERAAMVALLACGCGARSQLIEPDVARMDAADVRDVVDVLDVRDVVEIVDIVDIVDIAQDAPPSPTPPIDTTCPGTCPFRNLTPAFPAFRPLVPTDVPTECKNGFELGGANGGCGNSTYVLRATRAGGARAITLDVDFATYRAPDGVIVTGIDATGARYTLLQSCRLQTSTEAGPSTERPPDDTIRQFRLPVREGTREIDFDFGAVTTPMYIQVLGLCDFDVAPFTHAAFWRALPP